MILAGSDTTATTLAFALAELARHPDVAAAAAAEVEAVLGGADLGAVPADVYQSKLPLITAIANETLRLYPAATETGRLCAQVRGGGGVGGGGVWWVGVLKGGSGVPHSVQSSRSPALLASTSCSSISLRSSLYPCNPSKPPTGRGLWWSPPACWQCGAALHLLSAQVRGVLPGGSGVLGD